MLWLLPNNAIERHENQLIGEMAISNRGGLAKQPAGCFLFLQAKTIYGGFPCNFILAI
jgi:hypothetical protein